MKIDELLQRLGPATKGQDVQLAITSEVAGNVRTALENKTKALGRVGSYEHRGNTSLRLSNRSNFTPPPYDLAEIGRAADVEGYIANSVRKHREQILKEGYRITGPEDEMVQYVKKRLFEIALVTGIPTGQWIRELLTNLVKYHNAYIVLRRDRKRSSGKPIKMYNKVMEPIAGIFLPDPTTMRVKVDKYGTVKAWQQVIEQPSTFSLNNSIRTTTFKPEDVIAITVDKKSGYSFGTPYILPVLDDVRALRKLEELAVMLASKEAFPLYHYKVGTENKPAMVYQDGVTEVDQATSRISSLPEQGFIVTSERHEIELVSSKAGGLDISPFLEYFESRVLAGLRLSSVDLGRGETSNRGTASTMNKNMQDSAKDYQEVTSDVLTHTLIMWLLFEGNFDLTAENLVKFEFPMIDREELRAHQTHGLNLFLSDAITQNELRKEYLNKQELAEADTESMYSNMQLQNELKIIAATPRPASSSGSGSDGSIKKKVRTTNQPSNQHRTSPTKPRVPANDLDSTFDSIKSIAQSDTPNMETEIKNSIHSYISSIGEDRIDQINDKVQEGWTYAQDVYEQEEGNNDLDIQYLGNRALDRFRKNYVNKSYWAITNPFISLIKEEANKDVDENKRSQRILSHIDNMYLSVKKLETDQLRTAFALGFASFSKRVGYKIIEVKNKNSDLCRKVDISKIIYTNLIPKDGDIDITLGSNCNET